MRGAISLSNLTNALFEACREDLITADFMMESLKLLDSFKTKYKSMSGADMRESVALMSDVWMNVRYIHLPSDWKTVVVAVLRLTNEKPILKIMMRTNNSKEYSTFNNDKYPEISMNIIGAAYRHHNQSSILHKYDDIYIRYDNDGTGEPVASCKFGKKTFFGESTDDEYIIEGFHPIKSIKLHNIIKKERKNEKVKGSGEFGQKLYDSISKYINYGDLSEIIISADIDDIGCISSKIVVRTADGRTVNGLAYLGMNASKKGKEDNYYIIHTITPILYNFISSNSYEGKKLKGLTIRYYNDAIGLAYSIKYKT